MGEVFTSGDWRVAPGREDEFVAAWHEFAEWSFREFPRGSWAKLLRDREDPGRFRSFGRWADLETVEAWRASPGFQEQVGRLRELLESFEALTLDVAAEVG